MTLTQPYQDLLATSRSVLLAGCGGGYDVVGAIPLYDGLRADGKAVHLASLTIMPGKLLETMEAVPEHPQLFEVTPADASETSYCAEVWLARWLEERYGSGARVWCFQRTGVQPLRRAYRHLIDTLGVDTVVLVDGGIDSILRGDETSLGTPGGDLASVAAVAGLTGVETLLACLGFGSELRDGIPHAQALERIAGLCGDGHYLGCAALLPGMDVVAPYLEALEYVTHHQNRRSHVQDVVRRSLSGQFGEVMPDTWLSPLTHMYWFFALRGVAESHLFLEALEETSTVWEVNTRIVGLRKGVKIRKPTVIPL